MLNRKIITITAALVISIVILCLIVFLVPKIIIALHTRTMVIEANINNCPYSRYLDASQLKVELLVVSDSQRDLLLFCTLRDKKASLVKINTRLADAISEVGKHTGISKVDMNNYHTLLAEAVPYLIGDKVPKQPRQLHELVTFLRILDNDTKNYRAYWQLFWDQMTMNNQNRHLLPEYQPNYS